MPLAPYATLADLIAFLQEPSPDASREADLQLALERASEAIEDFTSRDFGPGQRTESVWSTGPVLMPKAVPVASLDAISQDGQPVQAVLRMGGSIIARQDGLSFSGEVSFTYTVTAPVPDSVVQATLMTAQAMSDAPAYDQNAGSSQNAGLYSFSQHAGGAGSIPPGALSLLRKVARVFIP